MRILTILAVLVMLAVVACGTSEEATPTTRPAQPTAGGLPLQVLQTPTSNVPTPDFTLVSGSGETVKFSDYLGTRPVVVVFYRGFF